VTSSLSSKEPASPGGGGLPWKRRGFGVLLTRSSMLSTAVGDAVSRLDLERCDDGVAEGVIADVTCIELGLGKSVLVIFCIFAATVNFSASFSTTFDCQVL